MAKIDWTNQTRVPAYFTNSRETKQTWGSHLAKLGPPTHRRSVSRCRRKSGRPPGRCHLEIGDFPPFFNGKEPRKNHILAMDCMDLPFWLHSHPIIPIREANLRPGKGEFNLKILKCEVRGSVRGDFCPHRATHHRADIELDAQGGRCLGQRYGQLLCETNRHDMD